MMMVADPCSHTMRQKSGTESGTGPRGENVDVSSHRFHDKLIELWNQPGTYLELQ